MRHKLCVPFLSVVRLISIRWGWETFYGVVNKRMKTDVLGRSPPPIRILENSYPKIESGVVLAAKHLR